MIVEHYRTKYITHLCEDNSGILVCPVDTPYSECNCQNRSLVYNLPEFALNSSRVTPFSHLELDPPLPFQFELIVKDCCSAARYCCRNTLVKYNHQEDAPCPATWDGWNCFDASNIGTVGKQCPNYIYGGATVKQENFEKPAIKECTRDGWKIHVGESGEFKENTNYMGCMSNEDAEFRLMVGIFAYSASVIFLIPAVYLLFRLNPIKKQEMFILHRHLLISCLAYGSFTVLTVLLYIRNEAALAYQIPQNHVMCRVLFSVQLRYLRMTNFSWMLAEGIYLFRLLHNAVPDASESMRYYKIFGWGIPAVITSLYSIVRYYNDDVGMCWIENSTSAWIEWMIFAPSLLAMGVNCLLLLIIVCILLKKLREDPHKFENNKIQYSNLRKAVRGALMLIPVFGLQQLFTIYRFNNRWYQLIDQVLNGMQGLIVSLIVCYTNKSVLETIEKHWSNNRIKRNVDTECRQRMSIQENGKLILKSPPANVAL